MSPDRLAQIQALGSRLVEQRDRPLLALLFPEASINLTHALVAMGDLAKEIARLQAALAAATEAIGFERNGFDKLAAVHDCLGTVKDLLKALDLIGDGIGGDVGFAVSAVANEAAMTAENALGEAGSMIAMRDKAVTK